MNTIWEDFKNAFNRPNNGLLQLIYINVAVFVIINILKLAAFFSGVQEIYHFPFSFIGMPGHIEAFILKPWTIITYFFTQEGFFHILFNMLGLYWFGRIIDDLIGNDRLIGIYVMGGIFGGLAYLAAYNLLPQFESLRYSSVLIGSSGSVFAIAVAAATLAPDYRFNLVFLGPIKIVWIVAVYVFLSLIQTMGTNAGGNIAHLDGAFMGYIFITQLRKGNELARPVIATIEFFKSLFKKKPKIKVSYRNTDKKNNSTSSTSFKTSNHPASSDEISQREIDEILDKISQSGYDSLTKEEKRKLFSASQKK